ncbi:MAG TPA: 4-hydroxy-3-methylbut-2-enyl diphosphate reductase, partial [Cellvibrionaceae bacterium]|nr:4-hydroxy-3-methylbut-2-enyl diphosphate reductase [Cellvibrionaceae bacterium]
EVLVQSVIHGLKQYGAQLPEELAGRVENVSFSLPKELR